MVDEVRDAKLALAGHISGFTPARACWLLAKFFASAGESEDSVTSDIFMWSRDVRVSLGFPVRRIVHAALRDPEPLRDDPDVRVSIAERDALAGLFPTRNARVTALAILCLAKAEGSAEPNVPVASLAEWIALDRAHVAGRYIPALERAGFIERSGGEELSSWRGKVRSRPKNFRILTPVDPGGVWRIRSNDIGELYCEMYE